MTYNVRNPFKRRHALESHCGVKSLNVRACSSSSSLTDSCSITVELCQHGKVAQMLLRLNLLTVYRMCLKHTPRSVDCPTD